MPKMKKPRDMYGNNMTETDSANMPETVKELLKSYALANDCLTLANESQRAEIEELRRALRKAESIATRPIDFSWW